MNFFRRFRRKRLDKKPPRDTEIEHRVLSYGYKCREAGAIQLAALLLKHDGPRGRFLLREKKLTYQRLRTLIEKAVIGGPDGPDPSGNRPK